MAWTAPRTWTDGELVTKAIMDPHVRDNFLAAREHLIARKTADQTVTSSTVLVDCTTMVLPVLANEVWQFEFDVLYSAGTTEDLKMGFTLPTAGRIDASVHWQDSAGTSRLNRMWGTTSPTTAENFAGNGVGSERLFIPVRGIYVGGANAGNVTLQMAQNTSGAVSTTIFTNSTVWAVKLA